MAPPGASCRRRSARSENTLPAVRQPQEWDLAGRSNGDFLGVIVFCCMFFLVRHAQREVRRAPVRGGPPGQLSAWSSRDTRLDDALGPRSPNLAASHGANRALDPDRGVDVNDDARIRTCRERVEEHRDAYDGDVEGRCEVRSPDHNTGHQQQNQAGGLHPEQRASVPRCTLPTSGSFSSRLPITSPICFSHCCRCRSAGSRARSAAPARGSRRTSPGRRKDAGCASRPPPNRLVRKNMEGWNSASPENASQDEGDRYDPVIDALRIV